MCVSCRLRPIPLDLSVQRIPLGYLRATPVSAYTPSNFAKDVVLRITRFSIASLPQISIPLQVRHYVSVLLSMKISQANIKVLISELLSTIIDRCLPEVG